MTQIADHLDVVYQRCHCWQSRPLQRDFAYLVLRRICVCGTKTGPKSITNASLHIVGLPEMSIPELVLMENGLEKWESVVRLIEIMCFYH